MKKVLLLILTIFFFCSQEQASANTVIVRGYVKDSIGNPVVNRTVKVFTNDSSQGCIFTHVVTTNSNGYYIDTVSCNTTIKNLFVKVEDCKGQWIVKNPSVTTTGDIEINFVICRPGTNPPVPCKALFQYSLTETGIKFSSTPSEIPAGDSIISRTWVFGDSSAKLSGNQADPWHEYKKAGSYTVCLTIKTKKGCESNYCKTIVFQPRPTDSCVVKADVTIEKISARKFRFSSKATTVTPGDTIVKRIWSFGDGTGHEGNEISPSKEYKDTGVYKACLKIKTKKGCENQYCFTVVVRDSSSRQASCKAVFTFSYKDTIAYFNSAASTAPAGDSIISRTWFYIDGKDTLKLEGNVIDTFIPYKVPGKYTVFLTIKTKKGCTSTFSGEVKIPEQPNTCHVQLAIKHERLTPRKFRFSSSQAIAAGDSIIKRKWKFGDGSIFEGNDPNPLKEYKDTGVYTVCLYIKTKKGCEKETCIQLWVKDSTVTPACKAQFTFNIHDKTVRFNSAASSAPAGDSIISRTWIFGDSSQPVTNRVDPSHTYAKQGVYTVYFYIKTKNGCESKQTAQVYIDSAKPATGCKAQFSFTIQDKTVKFNSAASSVPAGDSIISRTWIFGDSSQPVTNRVDPTHTYAKQGVYTVYFYIKTKNGCESKQAAQVYIDSIRPSCKIQAQFTVARVSGKKVLLNSMQTIAQTGDSIVSRKWSFGDGSIMDGNTESPIKEYNVAGNYNVCLTIKTKKGCEASVCKTVSVLDSIPAVLHTVKIISLNPNPVTTRMLATISSSNMNTEVEISVIDIYGSVKFSFKKVLAQGNNIVEVITANLPKGPYFLKVSSKGSKDTRLFYKF